ncbi:MAG: DUF4013 domain-containing protein [Methanomicrobiales archaeon]
MNFMEIMGNSLKYPFSNWMRGLILVFFIMIYTFTFSFKAFGVDTLLLYLQIFSIIYSPLIFGYGVRILKSSLNGYNELPEFDSFRIVIDGVDFFIVAIAYFIVILGLDVIFSGIPWIIVFLYWILILPVFLMSITNMAFQDSLGAAFKFGEIFNRISNIGGKFIILYIFNITLYLILILDRILMENIFTLAYFEIIAIVFIQIILIPYLVICILRLTALLYLSEREQVN